MECTALPTLIHARALLFAHHTVSRRPVYADATWASIYRAGDYCMPHSHLRSNLSIVYMLDPGDEDPARYAGGTSCALPTHASTRAARDEPGRVTQHVLPTMSAGTMLIFASDYLHSVNPYHGRKAAHHDVVEHHAGEIAGEGRRGLEDVSADELPLLPAAF